VRFGWSWPAGHGRRMWISGPWWVLGIWFWVWLAVVAVIVAIWVLLMLAEGIVWLLRTLARLVHRRPR
jgi:hypothetical protein